MRSSLRQLGAVHAGTRAAVLRLWTLWLGPVLVGFTLLALVWGAVQFCYRLERDAAEHAAIRHSSNLTKVLEAHLTRALHDLDRSLMVVRRSYALYPDGFDFRDWMHGSLLSDEQVLQLSVIDADGHLRRTSLEPAPPAPVDLRDRAHFRFFADGGEDVLHISKPVVGRASGLPSVQFARRIDNADGSFGGVLVASLNPDYFARFYSSIDVGPRGRIRVVGFDGVTRSVSTRSPEPLGLNLTGRTLLEKAKQSPVGWFYNQQGLMDGVSRLVSYRVMQDFPLIFTLALAKEELFAEIEVRNRWYTAIAAAVSLLIVLVVGTVIRSRHAMHRANEQVRSHHMQRDAALEHMSQGLSMFDRDGRLVICNNQYLQLYSLTRDEARPGSTLPDLLRARRRKGTFDDDIQATVDELAARLAGGTSFTLSSSLADGRTIVVVNCPLPGGGWVATHEDITRRTQAEAELDNTKRFLHSVIEHLPVPVMVKDPAELRYTLVNLAAEDLMGVRRADILGKRAQDFWDAAPAEEISARDRDLLTRGEQGVVLTKSVVRTPDGVQRVVNARRLVTRDKNDQPQHLILLIEDITQREEAEAQVVFMATHDPLTGLANRTLFNRTLETALAELSDDESCALLFIDLDRFKEINDTQGHLQGDKLLRIVADKLRSCAAPVDMVARLGGDEFAMIVRSAGSRREAGALASQIRRILEMPIDIDGIGARIGASIGIAMAPEDALEATELLKRADMALYRAKADGRNTVRFFEPEMDESLKARRELESDLREAVAAGAFELFYQPILNVVSNDIVGLEALLRWRHPRRGLVPPAEFIPLAEDTGLIVSLGEWVIRKALEEAARWPSHVRIAINLSPSQFASRALVPTLMSAMAASGVAAARIELEITERILMRDDIDNIAVLEQLRGLGIHIVMDDFGTGYSSLSYLHRFPFDKIKIDRSFVAGLSDGNDVSLAIIETVASLAETIHITTVAEGIETEAQLELIRSLGCSEYQGYLFSAPRPSAEIEAAFFPRADQASAA